MTKLAHPLPVAALLAVLALAACGGPQIDASAAGHSGLMGAPRSAAAGGSDDGGAGDAPRPAPRPVPPEGLVTPEDGGPVRGDWKCGCREIFRDGRWVRY